MSSRRVGVLHKPTLSHYSYSYTVVVQMDLCYPEPPVKKITKPSINFTVIPYVKGLSGNFN